MAELNEEGTHVTGRGHWSAYFDNMGWKLWYGNHEVWPAVNGDVRQVKRLVDLLNCDDRDYDSILTSIFCMGFDIDGPLKQP